MAANTTFHPQAFAQPQPALATPNRVHIPLTDADLDAWRDEVLFGAYTPDPEACPPPLPDHWTRTAVAPSPVSWMPARREGLIVQALQTATGVAIALAAMIATGQPL